VSDNGAYRDEMNEVGVFTDALRAAVPAQPSRDLTAAIVPRLATTARSSTIEAEAKTSRLPQGLRPSPPRSRLALVARVAVAVALIPLLMAGLAFGGVTVPGPARDVFHSVGITLPNQPSDHRRSPAATDKGSATTTGPQSGNGGSDAARANPAGEGSNSAAAHEHARKQHEKARGQAKGHQHGNAVGLNESTPPGQAKTPPGQAKTPPGQAKEAPSGESKKTPPGQAKIPPGQAKVPPGHSK
jgi:hypothetical protein